MNVEGVVDFSRSGLIVIFTVAAAFAAVRARITLILAYHVLFCFCYCFCLCLFLSQLLYCLLRTG